MVMTTIAERTWQNQCVDSCCPTHLPVCSMHLYIHPHPTLHPPIIVHRYPIIIALSSRSPGVGGLVDDRRRAGQLMSAFVSAWSPSNPTTSF